MNGALGFCMRLVNRVWRIVRWPVAIFAVLFVALVIYNLIKIPQQDAATIERIHSTKLTMKDVDGSNLPPTPDPALVDATVEGIDANNNGIRDDVELAIFKKYPNDIRVRAAALQYAMTEQLFLSDKIVGREIWKAAAEEVGRANLCVARTVKNFKASSDIIDGINTQVFNTATRTEARDSAFEHITSHGSAEGQECDVQL